MSRNFWAGIVGLNTRIFSEMCRWGGGGGGGARSLKGDAQGGRDPRDLAPGARSRGGGDPWDSDPLP